MGWEAPLKVNFYTDAFLQDWSYAGYHRGEKTLPVPSGKIYDVSKAPYNAPTETNTDATSAIQAAINDAQAQGGGIVYIPKGFYRLSPPNGANYCLKISASNIVLLGAGRNSTLLYNTSTQMRSKSIIRVEGLASWGSDKGTAVKITTDLMQPTSIIPVENTDNFSTGDTVIISNTITEEWIAEHKVAGWKGFANELAPMRYNRIVVAVNKKENTLTLDIPLRYALKTRDNARVYKIKGMLGEIGLQDFGIANNQKLSKTGWGELDYNTSGTAAYDVHGSWAISMKGVLNSWIRNISTFQPRGNTTGAHILSNGILCTECKNVTLDNCWVGHAQYGGGGGNGYAYRLMSNEVLVTNSTSKFVRHGFVFSNMIASGNVLHQCQDIQTGKQHGSSGNEMTEGSGSDHHMHFSHSNLIDGCTLDQSTFQAFFRPYGTAPKHNLTSALTAFWNIKTGSAGKGYSVWSQQARYGYVIGTSGPASAVKISDYADAGGSTDPVDILEGEGKGATLEPQSLYLDQLSKRLGDPVYIDKNVKSGKGVRANSNLKILRDFMGKDFWISSPRKTRVQMYSTSGKLLWDYTIHKTSKEISSPPQGVYVLRITEWDDHNTVSEFVLPIKL